MNRFAFAIAGLAVALTVSAQTITVGSKKFTESYVLGEIAKRTLENAGFQVDHKQGMGATAIVWGALKNGDISMYPEYTGTVSEEILKQPRASREAMVTALAKDGIGMSPDLGFNDAYGIVMRRKQADDLKIAKISDLQGHPDLKCGITHELLGRKDGWSPLLAKYGLHFDDVKGIDHALGYAALYAGQVDIKDCYTTDAEIKKYDLVVLQDDREFFPLYKAVFLYRLNLPQKAIDAVAKLAGTIDEQKMIAMNAEANQSKDYSEAATMYFAPKSSPEAASAQPKPVGNSRLDQLLPETLRHLELVAVSMAFAIFVGIPLGIWASKPGRLGVGILGVTGVIQTVPSLALLALLVPIPFFGISFTTAVVALFLYSLLPIVRNTAAGLSGIPVPLRESAAALGLEPSAQLRKVFLPMALPMILAGIKTSAVINVGTATLAALIGQGGLGEPIVSGLSLNDGPTILWGAIPAALLAIIVQVAFDLLEAGIVPRGLRLRPQGYEHDH
ncbi:MAG: glycine betaine ABC transporter substrate-binding protein [Fimbriimonas sp.]|nr:glycine betaine ABC transporter substrate-binding protein [Fimbriimonas sp.]